MKDFISPKLLAYFGYFIVFSIMKYFIGFEATMFWACAYILANIQFK